MRLSFSSIEPVRREFVLRLDFPSGHALCHTCFAMAMPMKSYRAWLLNSGSDPLADISEYETNQHNEAPIASLNV
jgi:hypothetical protein